MPTAVFLIWSLGFWPSVVLAEYFWVRIPEHTAFLKGDILIVLAITWLVGMVHSYRVYRIKQGVIFDDEDKDSDHDPNTLLIVEAPNDLQAQGVDADYIESEVYYQSLPTKGKRLVLNSEDDDDSNILGTVEEVAEGVHRFGDEKQYRVWIRLDRPEDYAKLNTMIGWDSGSGDKRRSTAPALKL